LGGKESLWGKKKAFSSGGWAVFLTYEGRKKTFTRKAGDLRKKKHSDLKKGDCGKPHKEGIFLGKNGHLSQAALKGEGKVVAGRFTAKEGRKEEMQVGLRKLFKKKKKKNHGHCRKKNCAGPYHVRKKKKGILPRAFQVKKKKVEGKKKKYGANKRKTSRENRQTSRKKNPRLREEKKRFSVPRELSPGWTAGKKILAESANDIGKQLAGRVFTKKNVQPQLKKFREQKKKKRKTRKHNGEEG